MANTGRGRPAAEVPEDNNFGAWLREWRTKRGMTGEALAFKVGGGMTQGRISAYETGRKKPEAPSAVQLAHALGVDPQDALHALMLDVPGHEPSAEDGLIRERDYDGLDMVVAAYHGGDDQTRKAFEALAKIAKPKRRVDD